MSARRPPLAAWSAAARAARVLPLILLACRSGDSAPDAAADVGQDLGAADSRPADVHIDLGADSRLTDAAPLDSAGLAGVTITLKGGQVVSGELIASYDHSKWWDNPGAEITRAVFAPSKLAPYPGDHSISLVSSLQVLSTKTVTLPPGTQRYRDALRSRGVVLNRVPLDGVSYVITANDTYHLEENGYGDFAWDLVRTDVAGKRFNNAGAANADYLVWDAEVYLPTGGAVVEVERDHPDNTPGSYAKKAPNNLVGIHLYGSFYLYLLHFKQGTIPQAIKVGSVLPAGAYLGRVGNAGVSLEPHLHFTVLWFDETAKRSWSLPSEMVDVYARTSLTGKSALHKHLTPKKGAWISSKPF